MQQYLNDYKGLRQSSTIMPDRVIVEGEVVYQGDHPIPWAIENIARRGVNFIHPGEYRGGKITKGVGGVFVAADPSNRPVLLGGPGDTLYFERPIGPTLFESLVIQCSDRTGVATYDDGKSGWTYRLDFRRVFFDGGYDHAKKLGRYTKWAKILHRWAGFQDQCVTTDVGDEHGDYPHHPMGDLFFTGCTYARCGRTGIQVVSREHEGGFSPHRVTVTDTTFADCGLADGGSALTVQGVKEIVVKRVASSIGRDRQFVMDYMDAHTEKARFGSGHFVNWSEVGQNENKPSDGVWFDNVSAETAEDFVYDGRSYKIGNAPAIEVTNAKRLVVTGDVRVISPAAWNPALRLRKGMPIDYSGLASHQVVGAVDWVEPKKAVAK